MMVRRIVRMMLLILDATWVDPFRRVSAYTVPPRYLTWADFWEFADPDRKP